MTQDSKMRMARRWIRHHLGIDIARWPSESLVHQSTNFLLHENVDLVIDVGANHGGYGGEIREHGYTGQILSFEPIDSVRKLLESSADQNWKVLPYAIGRAHGDATINIAGNHGASSSILPMNHVHRKYAPQAQYVDSQPVRVRSLDELWADISDGAKRPFLKIDVQGYELEVLKGAALALEGVVGIRIEMSLQPLYDGSLPWRTTYDFLDERGFQLIRVDPGFSDTASGQMFQFDAVFRRNPVPSA